MKCMKMKFSIDVSVLKIVYVQMGDFRFLVQLL